MAVGPEAILARPARASIVKERPEYILSPLLFAVVVIGWELGVRLLRIPVYIIPPPSQILVALARGLSDGFLRQALPGELSGNLILVLKALGAWFYSAISSREGYYLHLGYTFAEAMLGFFIGSSIGILFGTLTSQFVLLERTLLPYIIAFQSLPKVAVAPLLVIWFGFGMTSKVVIVCLLTFFPLLVNSIAGFKSVEPERIDLLRSLSATRWDIFFKVKFPSALPYIFAGLDMALVYAVIGAIVGEFVGAQRGLGVLIMQMNFAMDISGVFSVFILLSSIGVSLHLIMRRVRRRILFWAPAGEERTVGA